MNPRASPEMSNWGEASPTKCVALLVGCTFTEDDILGPNTKCRLLRISGKYLPLDTPSPSNKQVASVSETMALFFPDTVVNIHSFIQGDTKACIVHRQGDMGHGLWGIHGSWTGDVGTGSRWVWHDGWTHAHTRSFAWVQRYRQGREAEDVVVVVASPEPGGQSYRTDSRDRQMIRKPGNIVAEIHQTAPGRQEPGKAQAGIVVRDKSLRRSLGIRWGRRVGDGQDW